MILHFIFLQTVCPLRMQSLITVQKDITYPTEQIQFIGDVNVKQKSPLNCYLNFEDTSYNYSALTLKTINDYDPFNMFKIFSEYSERKCKKFCFIFKLNII